MRILVPAAKRSLLLALGVFLIAACGGYDESALRAEVEEQRGGAFTDEEWEDMLGAYETKCENEFLIESMAEYGLEEGDEKLLRLEMTMAEHLCPEHVHYLEDALAGVE
jgi:hypothetical protein